MIRVAQDLIKKVTMGGRPARTFPSFRSGDTVGVYVKVKEGEKERIQVFRGIVIKIQGEGTSKSFTVRKMSFGVGVERTFPFMSPAVDRVEVFAGGKVRRSRLFYLRGLRGKAAAVQSEATGGGETIAEALAAPAGEK